MYALIFKNNGEFWVRIGHKEELIEYAKDKDNWMLIDVQHLHRLALFASSLCPNCDRDKDFNLSSVFDLYMKQMQF